jgi:sugar lactone lactonase YvrE
MLTVLFERFSFRHGRGVVCLAMVLLCLCLASCVTAPSPRESGLKREIQWPPLPLMARIVWVKEIRDYQDVGISKAFWQRVTEFFTGEEDTRIGKPYGVYADDRQRLFIVDVAYALIHAMDLQENRYSVIGAENGKQFRSPIGITGDDGDNLYITDSGAGSIYRYSLGKGRLEPFIVSDLGRPTGIAFNRKNRLLYITDTTSHQVAVFDLRGNLRLRIGSRGDGPGQFNYPTDLFVDGRGRLYVTDALNSRVSIFSADGAHLKTFGRPGDSGGSFAKPKGIAVDSSGNIYVCDALLDTVQIFNDNGEFLLSFGNNGSNDGEFWMPSGIYIDKSDTIYVADSYNRRVQVFKYLNVDNVPDEVKNNGVQNSR